MKKPTPLWKEWAASVSFETGWVTPLPIVIGPEALRPALSRGLPFSHFFSNVCYRHNMSKPKALFADRRLGVNFSFDPLSWMVGPWRPCGAFWEGSFLNEKGFPGLFWIMFDRLWVFNLPTFALDAGCGNASRARLCQNLPARAPVVRQCLSGVVVARVQMSIAVQSET
jgi:hypothetical protein